MFLVSKTTNKGDGDITIHKLQDIENEYVPGYRIFLDEDFVWVAETVTPGGPTFRGSFDKVLSHVAAEQGWGIGDLEETLAYNYR